MNISPIKDSPHQLCVCGGTRHNTNTQHHHSHHKSSSGRPKHVRATIVSCILTIGITTTIVLVLTIVTTNAVRRERSRPLSKIIIPPDKILERPRFNISTKSQYLRSITHCCSSDSWIYISSAYWCSTAINDIMDSNDGTLLGDALVAALVCQSVHHPHTTGLGGGLVALFYNATTRAVEQLNAMPAPPTSWHGKQRNDITTNLTIAIPGFAYGLQQLLKKFGSRRNLSDVLSTAVDTLFNSFTQLDRVVFKVLRLPSIEQRINSSEALMKLFDKRDRAGLRRNQPLAHLWNHLTDHGLLSFYNDPQIAATIVAEMQAMGVQVTQKDFEQYSAEWEAVEKRSFVRNEANYFTTLEPTYGPRLMRTMACIDERVRRYLTSIGNPVRVDDFIQCYDSSINETDDAILQNEDPDDEYMSGTILIRDKHGNMIIVVSSLGRIFGSDEVSPQFGFIYNLQMNIPPEGVQSQNQSRLPFGIAPIFYQERFDVICGAVTLTNNGRNVHKTLIVIAMTLWAGTIPAVALDLMHFSLDRNIRSVLYGNKTARTMRDVTRWRSTDVLEGALFGLFAWSDPFGRPKWCGILDHRYQAGNITGGQCFNSVH